MHKWKRDVNYVSLFHFLLTSFDSHYKDPEYQTSNDVNISLKSSL